MRAIRQFLDGRTQQHTVVKTGQENGNGIESLRLKPRAYMIPTLAEAETASALVSADLNIPEYCRRTAAATLYALPAASFVGSQERPERPALSHLPYII